jgi:hypothetical protein
VVGACGYAARPHHNGTTAEAYGLRPHHNGTTAEAYGLRLHHNGTMAEAWSNASPLAWWQGCCNVRLWRWGSGRRSRPERFFWLVLAAQPPKPTKSGATDTTPTILYNGAILLSVGETNALRL